jgi:cell division protein FtsI/penicillin-binding protein 2
MRDYIQSMFVRRLLLLSAVAGAGAFVLGGRLAQLTVVKGSDLREQAEARLVRSQWLPTTRGRILDRKGRVLAQDRPSYDVAVTYASLSATWIDEQSRALAARVAGKRWVDVDKPTREQAIALTRQRLLLHWDEGWSQLARSLGIEPQQLDIARDRILREVQTRQDRIAQQREAKELATLRERGDEPSEQTLAKIARRAAEPIAEKRTSHVVRSRIDDQTAFSIRELASEQVSLDLREVAQAMNLPASDLGAASVLVPVIPGVSVIDTGDREYPLEALDVAISRRAFPLPESSSFDVAVRVDGLASHIIGRLRDRVFGDEFAPDGTLQRAGDKTRRERFLSQIPQLAASVLTPDGIDRGAYREGDRVGDTGVEASMEPMLRGLRGRTSTRVDGGEGDFLAAEPGSDVVLSLDAMLQARVQALLDPSLGLARVQPWHGVRGTPGGPTLAVGEPLYGAAVVLDVATGDLLAAVSTPTFTSTQMRESFAELARDDLRKPLSNRAWGVDYAAGSIVKPIIYVGAVERGLCGVDERIACDGYLIPGQPNILQCLIWKRARATHSAVFGGPLSAEQAIGASCNIYFYTLGRRLGPRGIVDVYREFGVGSTFGLGAGAEFAGHLGMLPATPGGIAPPLEQGDAIQMGIGQGPISWTPLHAASSYAAIAKGELVVPRLILSPARDEPTQGSSRLAAPPEALQQAMAGLWFSINNERGTGHHISTQEGMQEPIFNAPGVRVWGKTGTATAPALLVDPDGEGPLPRQLARDGDHSWFVILAGRDSPRYAIAVVMDYAGSGGKVSGPIANQIVHALIAEGYL